jgi:hypothetical protein
MLRGNTESPVLTQIYVMQFRIKKEEEKNMKYFKLWLLIIVALFVALSVQAQTPTKKQQTIAAIEKLGGKVELNENLSGKPIVKVDFHNTQITDTDLKLLKKLSELRNLDLRFTKIGDAGMAHLKKLKKLQMLNLFRTQISDKGLKSLKKLKDIQTLLIGGTKVTDAGLASLKSLPKLRKISLFQTQVTDAGIEYLKVLSNLEILLISGSKITESGIKNLQTALPRVRFTEMM